LLQLSAAAGAANTAVDAASAAAKPQSCESLVRSVTCFLPCDAVSRTTDVWSLNNPVLQNVRMFDEHPFTLRQVDPARDDFCVIESELDVI
jgi:hypothetical protein